MLLNKKKAIQLLNNFVKENKSLLNDRPFTVFTPKKESWGVYFQGRKLGAINSFCGISYEENKVYLKLWEKIDYAKKRIDFIKSIKNTTRLTIEYEEAGIYTEEPLSTFTKWNGLKESSFCQISSDEYSSKKEVMKMLKRIVGIYIDFLPKTGKKTANNADEITLQPIRSEEDLKDNLRYIETLLRKRNVDIRDLIANGINYVYYKFNGQDRFAPSRFVGYKKNSIQRHSKAINKHGGVTDKKISNIMGSVCNEEPNLENKLKDFFEEKFEKKGKLKNKTRKFWKTGICLYSTPEQVEKDLYEKVRLLNKNRKTPPDLSNYGKITGTEANHKTTTCDRFERDPKVIADTLQLAEGICQGCGRGRKPKELFRRASDGTPYLEVHHIIPLSNGGIDDLSNACALCPICHRLLHHGIKEDKEKILKNITESRKKQLKKYSKQ